ncbi:ORF78 peptide [Hyphantria cunea nucleopolyhedrovirus]|uniref:ORF78 peptide n=1 Tax=Hyphantria cunea nuclear polyhedrosis virus TaxID=28288 RepID=Q2NNZ4_NPVHC|nr:ORF78 peptide [Hyphantria cunea nucleopolyhedrovirus]BAE72367.1 ORF78 peptide [Hyphantria cunea nucleopolyhedrovirus]
MTTPQAELIAVQKQTLDLTSETNTFLMDNTLDKDLETRLTTLIINVNNITFDADKPELMYYKWLKSNIVNCINILIDLIIIKKYV